MEDSGDAVAHLCVDELFLLENGVPPWVALVVQRGLNKVLVLEVFFSSFLELFEIRPLVGWFGVSQSHVREGVEVKFDHCECRR